jgi:hypothetical protein
MINFNLFHLGLSAKITKLIQLTKAFLHITFLLLLILCSCTPSYKSQAVSYKEIFNAGSPSVPDYADLRYWAAHPWKKDPSDSIPKPLLYETRDSLVDVFFLHPTTLTDKKLENVVWNADINDAALNSKTDYSSMLYQASVFNKSCRVFAPRYRQAHLYAFYSSDKEKNKQALDFAYEDVKAAFEYYLKYSNNGRPIIIAGHSQGTFHSARLLKEYFENKPLQKQLVCAYIIGMALPKPYFTDLKPCTDSLATGCFMGWRTFHTDFVADYVKKEQPSSSWVVNPLSWDTTNVKIGRTNNPGAVLYNFEKIYKNTNSAAVVDNVLWTNKPKFALSFLLRTKNYHAGDINLYYLSIRNNIDRRIQQYFLRFPDKK